MGGFQEFFCAVILVSATLIANVQAGFNVQEYFEFIPKEDTIAFQPGGYEPVANKGIGYVKNNDAVRSDGKVIGKVRGMYFYTGVDTIEDIVTVTFRNLGGSINLRGIWRMTADGQADKEHEELSIVGGQGSLQYASGVVYYNLVQSSPQTVFKVRCEISYPSYLYDEMGAQIVNPAEEKMNLLSSNKTRAEFWAEKDYPLQAVKSSMRRL